MTKNLLPASLEGDKNVEAICGSCDHVFALERELQKLLIYARIDELNRDTLDMLAWQLHVEGWEFLSSDEERRDHIRRAIQLHRLKGTRAGIKYAAKQAGSKIIRIIEPPCRFYLSTGMSKEEKNGWLRQFPQLRIYPRRDRGKKQGMIFWKDYLGSTFPRKTDAIVRMTVRATLYKDGKETDLVTGFWEYEYIIKDATLHVKIPGRVKFASFAGRTINFLAQTDASVRTVWIEKTIPYLEEKKKLSIRAIAPGLRPIHADSEWIAERGTQRTMFCDSAKSFFIGRSDAVRRMYYVYYLFDPERAAWKRRGSSYLGATRLGMPNHTCEAVLDVTKKDRRKFRFIGQAMCTSDMSRLEKVFQNIRDWNRCSVKLLVDTRRYKRIMASFAVTASEGILAGQYKEVA